MVPDLSSINVSLEALPEFLRARDLVKLGLFGTRFSVTNAVRRGDAPPCIKLSAHKVIFPKSSLRKWLLDCADKNSNMGIEDDSVCAR